MVKKNLFRYSSVLMCVVLTAASLVGCGAGTTGTTGTDTAYVTEMAAGSTEDTITAAINNELAVSNKSTLATNTRQETVYVFSDASGKKNHITVNEKVTDANGKETLNKTESNENAPVTMKVTYKLDGKDIKPEDLAGKSGKVTIRFDYTNNQKKDVTINGKKQSVCVPFTMVTGMMLPTDVFSNVEVTNGKLTKVGDNIVAVGMTMPGLKDTMNLKFNNETLDLDIPEYFELTADVTDFSLDMTMSVATSNFLSDMDVDDITLDDLKKTVSSLNDAATQLADGTVTLQEGTQQLNDAVPALTDGVDQLNDGAGSLKEGIYAYTDGVSSAYEGSVSLNDNMKTYADGIGTLYNTLKDKQLDVKVAEAASGASQLSAYATQLNGGVKTLQASLQSGKTEAETGYNTAYNGMKKIANAAHLQNDTLLNADPNVADENQYLLATQFIMENYSTFRTVVTTQTLNTLGISAGVFNALPSESEQKKKINSEIDKSLLSMTTGLTQAHSSYLLCVGTLQSLTTGRLFEAAEGIDGGLSTLSTGLNELSTSVGSFSTYKEGTLCSSLYALNLNAGKLQQEGTAVLQSGLSQLTANNDTLKNGASQLADGTATLKDSSGTLAEGVTQLNDGAITLKDGMAQFNSEAIEPITKLVDSDAQTAVDTIKAVVKAGQEYNSFLGRSDDKEGSVTFVYKTAGITVK